MDAGGGGGDLFSLNGRRRRKEGNVADLKGPSCCAGPATAKPQTD